MKTIHICGDNRFAEYTKVREACRGVVLRAGAILLTYERNTDQWFLPGGGLEPGETLEACCARELAEETGLAVRPGEKFALIHEYYGEWLFTSSYFLCEIVGEAPRRLTDREAEVGLEPRWVPLEEAVSIFAKHPDYAGDEMKRGAYLREYRALQAFLEEKNTDYTVIPFEPKYRDDMIFMVLQAKDALGRVPGLNEDLLDVEKNFMAAGGMFWLAIGEDGRVIGSIGYKPIPGIDEVRLHRLFVKASLKRRGIGTRLLNTAEQYLRTQGKTAVHIHLGGPEFFESRQFYPKHGYVPYGEDQMKKEL